MMEYQGPNQRFSGGFESLFGQNVVQNLPQQLTQELNEAMGKMSIKPSDSIGPHPERPGVADCAYYSRTGSCAFGMNCRFNHPPNSKQVPQSGDTPQKAGQPECQYYVKGTCKFGTTCKFEHSNQKEGCGQQLQFNFMGLPIREGERQCPYYLRTGSCRYGVTCKFHHPEPASESGSVSSSSLQMNRTNPLASSSENSNFPVHPSGNLPNAPYASSIRMQEHTAYMDATYPFPQDMTQMPALSNNYQTNSRSLSGTQTISAIGTRPFGVQSTATVTGRNTFPERPGQPECQHYLKTGNCKFAAACRFHHPRNNEQSGLRNFSLSSEGKQLSVGVDFENTIKNSNDLTTNTQGSVFSPYRPVSSLAMTFPVLQTQTSLIQKCRFPERPGQAECQHYMKTGDCKFGDGCLFHHPKERLEQSSAYTNLPVHFVHQSPFSLSEEKQNNIEVGIVDATKQTNDWAFSAMHSAYPSTQPIYSATMGVSTVESQEFPIQRESFPERPGQPECQHYMKTGNCKFGAVCRYHHPKENSEKLACNLSKMGLPLNPDKPACTFYSRYGICKFGPMCKYDHSLPASTCSPSARLNSELPGDQFPKGNPSTNT